MKRTTIIGIALTMGILSAGALSVSAADAQAVNGSSSSITSTIKAKELELREQYAYDRVDSNRVAQLETEIRELKVQANLSLAKSTLSSPTTAVYQETTP